MLKRDSFFLTNTHLQHLFALTVTFRTHLFMKLRYYQSCVFILNIAITVRFWMSLHPYWPPFFGILHCSSCWCQTLFPENMCSASSFLACLYCKSSRSLCTKFKFLVLVGQIQSEEGARQKKERIEQLKKRINLICGAAMWWTVTNGLAYGKDVKNWGRIWVFISDTPQ